MRLRRRIRGFGRRSASQVGAVRRFVTFGLTVTLVLSVSEFSPMPATAAPAKRAAQADPLPREATAPVGAIEASHAVTDGGKGVYTVGIDVPPGLAGLAPKIALTSTSAAGDGVLGEGWDVSGFSVIERCALSSAQSNGWARPIEDPNGQPDAFCLDGQLLVVTAGAYGADGSEYRTEKDTFARVVASRPGGDAAGPEGFEVRAKDGGILRYGFATDAVTRVSANGARRRWALKEQRDRSGNYLEIAYGRTCTPPDPVPMCTRYAPAEVRYGGHRSPSGAVQAHDRAVRFVYESRTDGWSAFSRGLRDLESRRLNRIETVVDGAVVRRYRVDYDTRQDVTRPTRLRECVDDGDTEVCKQPTTFGYDNSQGFPGTPTNGPVVPRLFGNGLGSDGIGRTIVLDANGDGLDDLVFPAPERRYTCAPDLSDCSGGWEYRLATATGNRSAPYTITDLDLGSEQYLGDPFWCVSQDAVVDYNGDGRDDLVSSCGPHKYGTVLVSTGQSFTEQRIEVLPASPGPAYPFWLADLNGDALSDVLVCRGNSLFLHLNRGPRAGFDAARTLPNFGHLSASPLRGIDGSRGGEQCEAPLLLDSDGDGVVNALKRDWTYRGTPSAGTFLWTQTWKALSIDASSARWVDTGLTFDERIDGSAPDPQEIYDLTPYWAGDVMNDDPSDDKGQVTTTTYARKWQLRVLDVNGDGLDDILRYDGSQANPVRLHTNTGSGFGTSSPALTGLAEWDWYRVSAYGFARAQFLDYDNDGRDDVLLPVGDPRRPAELRWVVHRARDRSSYRPELVGTWNLAEPALPVRADVDGDGSSDLLLAADVAGLRDSYGNVANRLTVRWGAYAKGNLLTSARDGLGESVLFGYDVRDANQARTYQRTPGCQADHSWCANRAGPLVSSVMVRAAERPTGPQPDEIQRRISWQVFHYEDARRAWYGRGSLGFRSRVTTSYGEQNTDLIETVTRVYDNKTHLDRTTGSTIRHWFPYAGRVVAEAVRSAPVSHGLAAPTSVQQVTNTGPARLAVKLSADSVPFVVEEQNLTETAMRTVATGAERKVTSTSSASEFDEYGNQTHTGTITLNGAGAQVERSYTATTYDHSASRRDQWLISLPLRQATTHTRQGRAQTRTTAYTHSADRGLPLVLTREPDDAAYTLTETSSYDEYGNVLTQVVSAPGEEPRTVTTSHDARGLFPVKVVNPEGHVITMMTDSAFGRSLVQTDQNGVVTRSAYDGLGRLVRERGPIGDTVTTFARADNDANADVRARLRSTTQVAGGTVTAEYQDALGRSIETRVNGYGGTTVHTATTYDWADRPVTVSRPHLPGDTSQGVTRTTYDALGRTLTQSRPDEEATNDTAVSSLRYGWPEEAPSADTLTDEVRAAAAEATAVTDPLGRRTVALNDHAGGLVASVDAAESATQVEYAPWGAVRRILNPAGAATEFDTDRYGRNTAIKSADTGRHTYTWSAFGQLRSHGDPRGVNTQYTYDRLGRMTKRADPRGNATWAYDGPGPNTVGRLVDSRSAEGHRTQLSYEPVPESGPNRGLLAGTAQTVDGQTHQLGFGYDQYGRVTHIEYPEAAGQRFGVDQAYDANGLLTEVRDSTTQQPYWTFVDDDQGYRVGVERLGNGITTTSSFRPLSGRLRSTWSAVGTDWPVQQLSYGYDAVGNLRHLRDGVRADRSRHYQYDTLNRPELIKKLTGNDPATPGEVVEDFAYNDAGNIVAQVGVGAYDYTTPGGQQTNAVTKAGQNTYGYDAAGNQTSRAGPDVVGQTQTIAYTPANLPSVVGTKTAGKTTFEYGAGEQRVLRRAPDAVTTYLADLYERRAEVGNRKVEHRYYVQADGRAVAQVVRDEDAGRHVATETRYEHPDRLGTPLDQTNESGASDHSQQFTAFGENLEPDWRKTGERGFAGHQTDSDLGLIDTEGRLYDPVLGRFLSADPVITDAAADDSTPGDQLLSRAAGAVGVGTGTAPQMSAADLLQPYAYAANNPLTYVDSDGRNPSLWYRAKALAQRVRDSTVGQAVAGFTVGVTQGAAPGGFIAGPVMSHYAPTPTFEFFRGAGETTYGAGQLFGGTVGMGGGGAACLSGGGCVAGAPVAAGAAVVAAEGGADMVAGIVTMWHAMTMDDDGSTGGGESTGGRPAAEPPAAAPPASGPVHGPSAPPASVRAAVNQRAQDLQNAVPANTRGRVTMAVGVGKDAAGKTRTVVGTSAKRGYLRPGVKLAPGEELARGSAGHAEENVLIYMRENGITPEWVAAGRPICRGRCLPAILDAGAQPASPVKAPPKPPKPPRTRRR